ncbi:MAG: D-aminoacylase [Thermoanaerobaculia bacterium]|nr:D-aminoacylase [Thermoanaerobaculia bacterium]
MWRVTSVACLSLVAAALVGACEPPPRYDVLVRNGTLIDGTGAAPRTADLAVVADRIVAVGDLPERAEADLVLDADGLIVAPGFINMLSWATESLIEDGRAQSDVRQGVTLEVFGEGFSMGPLNDAMKQQLVERQGDIRYDVSWTTLGEYLEFLVERGVSPNVASFVGATTVRVHEVGYDDRPPTAEELERMKQLVARAMEEGALGVGSSLIYAPAFYSDTAELIELARIAAAYDGLYISHIRNEGNRLEEAVEELLEIAREADIPAEIYHLKAAGRENWSKLERVIERIEAARADGLEITADIYPYTAGATGLDAAMPPWVQEGGHDAWVERLNDPAVRRRVAREMTTRSDAWENLFLAAGAEGMLLVDFKNEALKPLTGRTLAEVAAERGLSPEETAIELVIEDDSRVGTIYFLMSEENVHRKAALPWVSFGSDEAAPSAEGVFLRSNPHPRAYGTFARAVGPFVRQHRLMPLEEAVRKLTSLPAETLGLVDRGRLAVGYKADLAIFDAARIQDHATYAEPHQYATGMVHVLVNGVPVLRHGEHTGALPGEVVRGPGWRGDDAAPEAGTD